MSGSGEDTGTLSKPLQPLGQGPLTDFLSRPAQGPALNHQQPTDVWGQTNQGSQPHPKGPEWSCRVADGTTEARQH